MTIFALIILLNAHYSPLNRTFTFFREQLKITPTAAGALFTLPDGEFLPVPGAPALPAKPVNLPLPPGVRLTDIKITRIQYETLPGNFEPAPVPPANVLSLPPAGNTFRDPKFYNPARVYPESVCRLTGQGTLRGRRYAALLLFPLQFLPEIKRVRLVRKLELALEFEDADDGAWRDTDTIEYMILTTRALDTVFSELCAWRAQTGLHSALRTVEWVTANYPGRDRAEKVRNYVKICARDSGLRYLVLGGDVDLVPVRRAFAFACSAGLHPREDSLPCDLYYSCVDGDWDANRNGVFGEVEDGVDLYPDIYVGRVPVNTPAEARSFVRKLIAYESGAANGYQTRAVFSAAVLWNDPYTDEGVAKDRIEAEAFPARFAPIYKLYESRMAVTTDTARALLNAGCGIFNHCGHGWIDALSLGRGATLRNPDIDALSNSDRLGIAYSIGCWTAAFDFDAIAEHFLRNPAGGGVAFIGNSSYGWGAPGNPGFGYSDRFDARFFKELFSSTAPRLGEVLARTKLHFLPLSQEPNVYRWHQFCINLLGDPALTVHTATLAPQHCYHPSHLPPGDARLTLVIQDDSGPVRDATVTVIKDRAVICRAHTRTDGTALLHLSGLTTGTVRIAGFAPNHLPLIDSIPVTPDLPIYLADHTLLNPAAETTELLSPGKTFALHLTLASTAPSPLPPLRCSLELLSPKITLRNPAVQVPGIPGNSRVSLPPFFLETAPDAKNGETALLNITVADTLSRRWQTFLALRFGTPLLKVERILTATLPPDTVNLFVKLTNTGLAPANRPTGTLFSPDPSEPCRIIVPALLFPDIGPGETAWSLTPARLLAPKPTRLGINITTEGALFSDTLIIYPGRKGLSANFDSGIDGFTTGGENLLWHTTSRRYSSPPYSIHPGDESGTYPDNARTWLLSPWFILPETPVLKFRRWFSLPIYGVDGLYVLLVTAHKEETLDFIGSGGALEPRALSTSRTPASQHNRFLLRHPPSGWGLNSDWLEQSYDLSPYQTSESVRLKFLFVSDSDGRTGEGFYLDDIVVTNAESLAPVASETTRLLSAFPNPLANRTTVFYSVAEPGFVELNIYDATGRRVKTLVTAPHHPGWFSVVWDATDHRNKKVAPGVYFLQLTTRDPSALPRGKTGCKLIKR